MFFRSFRKILKLILNFVWKTLNEKSIKQHQKNDYTEIFMTSTIYMFENVVETSIEQFSQITIIQIWRKESKKKNVKKMQKTFSR